MISTATTVPKGQKQRRRAAGPEHPQERQQGGADQRVSDPAQTKLLARGERQGQYEADGCGAGLTRARACRDPPPQCTERAPSARRRYSTLNPVGFRGLMLGVRAHARRLSGPVLRC